MLSKKEGGKKKKLLLGAGEGRAFSSQKGSSKEGLRCGPLQPLRTSADLCTKEKKTRRQENAKSSRRKSLGRPLWWNRKGKLGGRKRKRLNPKKKTPEGRETTCLRCDTVTTTEYRGGRRKSIPQGEKERRIDPVGRGKESINTRQKKGGACNAEISLVLGLFPAWSCQKERSGRDDDKKKKSSPAVGGVGRNTENQDTHPDWGGQVQPERETPKRGDK